MGGSWSNNQNPVTGVQICPTDPMKVQLSREPVTSSALAALRLWGWGAGRLTCCWWCRKGNTSDFCYPSCFQIVHTRSSCQRLLSQGLGGVWLLVEQVLARKARVPSGIAMRHSGSGSGCHFLFPSFWRMTVSVTHASRSLLWLYSQSPDTVWVTCNSYLPRKVSYLWEGLPSVALALPRLVSNSVLGLQTCATPSGSGHSL